MKYFCLPSDFKNETINAYHEINVSNSESKIVETYGQMAPDTVFGSCRVSKQLPIVDRVTLEKYIKHSRYNDIDFNYVVNTTCMENDDLTSDGFKRIKKFFLLLKEIGATSLTLALPSLIEIAKATVPELKIKASTVCQINSPFKAKFYDELGVKRLVVDEDIYRRFDLLKAIRKAYSGELEVIVNSFCVNDCPYKMFHYNSLSFSHMEKDAYPYYSSRCRNNHIGTDNFIKLNWIRPEDIHFYNEIGINYFKIQGRTNVYSGDPVRTVKHYIDGHYDGDLIKLLELFSSKRPLTIAEIALDNRKLDGFLSRFVTNPQSCSKLCDECGYCKAFSEECINSTDRFIMDMVSTMNKSLMWEFPGSLDK